MSILYLKKIFYFEDSDILYTIVNSVKLSQDFLCLENKWDEQLDFCHLF